MSRSPLLPIVVWLSLCAIAASAQQPTAKPSERFQIISATVTDAGSDTTEVIHVVFLLDTQTGQVWKYVPRVGGLRPLKPTDQYSTDKGGTALLLSPGGWVPISRIEFADDSKGTGKQK